MLDYIVDLFLLGEFSRQFSKPEVSQTWNFRMKLTILNEFSLNKPTIEI